MSLLLYNYNTMIFTTFWTHTCSPHKIVSFITSGKSHLSLLLMQRYSYLFWRLTTFLDTSRPSFHGGIIWSPFIHLSSDYRSTSHISTSTTLHPHITYVSTNFLPKQSPKKWRTYTRSILPTYCVFVLHLLNSIFLQYLSVLRSTPRVQTVSFTAHTSMRTNTLTHFFMCYLLKGQRKYPLQYSLMFHAIGLLSLMNFISYTNVTSSHQENHFCKTFPDLNHHLQYSISACIYTSSDPTFSRGEVVGWLHSVRTSYQSTAWSDSLPANLLVELEIAQ